MIETILNLFFCFLSAPNSPKTKRGANGKFLPKPLLFHLRHPNSKTDEPKFWQILSPKNSFAKTSSIELALEFRQFLLWRNPTSPATTIPNQKRENPRQTKKNAWWRGEGGAEQQKRRQTVVPDSLVERRLCRDGIHRGAYDLVSSHHTLRACHIICFEKRYELGTIQTHRKKGYFLSTPFLLSYCRSWYIGLAYVNIVFYVKFSCGLIAHNTQGELCA